MAIRQWADVMVTTDIGGTELTRLNKGLGKEVQEMNTLELVGGGGCNMHVFVLK